MTELSFLIDLLMNHRLQKTTKDLIAARIKDVEAELSHRPAYQPAGRSINSPNNAHIWKQAPSTIDAMIKHGDIPQNEVFGNLPAVQIPAEPIAVIAQTPATAAAMQSRQQAIAQAISGVVEKGQTKPRKF